MIKMSKDAKNFVEEIVGHLKKDAGNERPFPKMQNLLKKVSDSAWKENTAKITTAVVLNFQEKEQLVNVLSHRLNKPITLECTVRPTIVGGIKIEIADLIIDLSYEEKLRGIEAMLLKGNYI